MALGFLLQRSCKGAVGTGFLDLVRQVTGEVRKCFPQAKAKVLVGTEGEMHHKFTHAALTAYPRVQILFGFRLLAGEACRESKAKQVDSSGRLLGEPTRAMS